MTKSIKVLKQTKLAKRKEKELQKGNISGKKVVLRLLHCLSMLAGKSMHLVPWSLNCGLESPLCFV